MSIKSYLRTLFKMSGSQSAPKAEDYIQIQCWGPSKKKHFGQANLKRGQVN